jgi:exopolysaccharide biosynthesis polyprenyl glycosylphosphotransferase
VSLPEQLPNVPLSIPGLIEREPSPDNRTVTLALAPATTDRKRTERFETAVTLIEVLADFLAVLVSALLSYGIYRHFDLGRHAQYSIRGASPYVCLFAIFFVFLLDRSGAYRSGNGLLNVKETERVLRVSAESFLLIFPVTFLIRAHFSRWLLVLAVTVTPLLVLLEKHGARVLIHALHAKGYGVSRVIIYGAGYTGRRLFSALVRSPKLGMQPVAFVDDNPGRVDTKVFELGYQRRRSAPVIRGPVTRDVFNRFGASQMLVAIPSLPRETFLKAMTEAAAANVKVSFVPNYSLPGDSLVEYQNVDGLLLSTIAQPLGRPGYELIKKLGDVIASLVLLILTAPFFGVITWLIRRDSPGPALFTQERVGRDGHVFRMYKFRTMHVGTPTYECSPTTSDDPRITRVGRYLRRTSLDELPQLLNVLRGDMCLVGPRPEMPFIVSRYTERERQRLQVKPGITGLWQLSADRAYLIHENIQYDLYYLQNRCFFMDVAILLHTALFAMRGI